METNQRLFERRKSYKTKMYWGDTLLTTYPKMIFLKSYQNTILDNRSYAITL